MIANKKIDELFKCNVKNYTVKIIEIDINTILNTDEDTEKVKYKQEDDVIAEHCRGIFISTLQTFI